MVDLIRKHSVLSVLLFSLAFKLVLIFFIGDHVYYDVNMALSYGREYFENSGIPGATFLPAVKTYLGPVLWYQTYERAGLYGLKAINIAAFVLLFAVQYLIGRKLYKPGTVVAALFIFSFYVGTNLNVAAGEQDDMMAALFFSLGILLYVYRWNAILCALVMSCALLFKFTTGIYVTGFFAYLLVTRRWRDMLLTLAGFIIPFLCLGLLDGFSSVSGFLSGSNAGRHFFNTPWRVVLFKLFSTGMIFSVCISAWTVTRERSDRNILFFCLSSVYFFYVLIARNAYTAGFIMMQSVLFSSFLIAECLLADEYPGKIKQRKVIATAVLTLYLLITSGITIYNLTVDTLPVNPFQSSKREGPSP